MENILLQNYNYVGPVPREGRVAKGDPKALSLSQCFSNANVHTNYLGNLVRIQILIQEVRDEARDYLSNKLSGEVNAAGLWTTL